MATTLLSITLLSSCANDLIIDYGKGNAIHLVGSGNNFDCDDSAYAGVEKFQTWTLAYSDGTEYLCALERPKNGSISTIQLGSPKPNPSFKRDALKRTP